MLTHYSSLDILASFFNLYKPPVPIENNFQGMLNQIWQSITQHKGFLTGYRQFVYTS